MNKNFEVTDDFLTDHPNITLGELTSMEYAQNYKTPYRQPFCFDVEFPPADVKKELKGVFDNWATQDCKKLLTKIYPELHRLRGEVQKLIQKPKIAVLGLSDSGKSSFINDLLGQKILPSAWSPTTSVILYLKHWEDRPDYISDFVCVFQKDNTGNEWNEGRLSDRAYCESCHMVSGGFELLEQYSHLQNSAASAIVVFVDFPMLKNCDIIDAPGLAGGLENDNQTAKNVPLLADGVIYLSPANAFLGDSDIGYIQLILTNLAKKGSVRKGLQSLMIVASQLDVLNGDYDSQCRRILKNGSERLFSELNLRMNLSDPFEPLLSGCFYGYSIYLQTEETTRLRDAVQAGFTKYYKTVKNKSSHFLQAAYQPIKKTVVHLYEFAIRYFMDTDLLFFDNTLFCKNGETVRILSCQDGRIRIEYHGKEYDRSIDSLGVSFFFQFSDCSRIGSCQQRQSGYATEKQPGHHLPSYDRFGYDGNGYDQDGYNRLGFGRDGYNKEGYDSLGFGRDGYNKEGYDCIGLNRKMELHPSNKYAKLLFPNETLLYHSVFGEGIYKGLEKKDQVYLQIQFSKKDNVSLFKFPGCFDKKQLLFVKTKDYQMMEKYMATLHGQEQFSLEEKHLSHIVEKTQKEQKKIEEEASELSFDRLYGDESRFSQFLSDIPKPIHTDLYQKKNRLEKIEYEPYFARVDCNGESLYIGKHAFQDILEWTDPRCSVYYEYQSYIGNPDCQLTLVRNLIVKESKLFGIYDVYSEVPLQNETTVMVVDNHLMDIIKEQRSKKSSHDIAETLQKNQYLIVTTPLSETMLVNGCAGSGKTMILFHRIKYLLKNLNSLRPENVIVLTPTRLLNRENKKISGILELDSVRQFFTIEFYTYLCKTISSEKGIYLPPHTFDVIEQSKIAKEKLCKLYSIETLDLIAEKINFVTNNIKGRVDYIWQRRKDLEQQLYELMGGHSFREYQEKLKVLDEFYQSYLEVKEVCSHYSVENVEAMIKKLSNELEQESENELEVEKEKKKRKEKLTKLKREIGYLQYLKKAGFLLSGKTKFVRTKNSKGDLLVGPPETVKERYESLYRCFSLNRKDLKLCPDEQLLSTFDEVYLPILSLLKRLKEFENGKFNICVFEILDEMIQKAKAELELDSSVHYEWELFWKTDVCSRIGRGMFDGVRLFFVDEMQDYSVSEIKMLQSLFRKAKFNFYGDFMQAVNEKSMSREDFENSDIAVQHQHNLKTNYRNAKEITEYINQNLHTDMVPIGIDGVAAEISVEEVFSIPIDPDDRIAMIVKDSLMDEMYPHFETNPLVCFIKSKAYSIQKGKLNFMPVSAVKGLEFEKAIVIPQSMNENEQYLAMTRALNELYVIKL